MLQRLFRFVAALCLLLILVASNSYAQEMNVSCDGSSAYCAQTSHPVVASYSTMGYWALSGFLRFFATENQGANNADPFANFDGESAQFESSPIKHWAALVYILTLAAAIIMVAMGQPPKMYVWYAAGPALFFFLVYVTEDRAGVAWQLGHGRPQDHKVVCELAESSIKSSVLFQPGRVIDCDNEGANNNTEVPWMFAWIDSVTSEVVQNFVGSFGLANNLGDTNYTDDDVDNSNDWHLMSNAKWEMMENVTMSRLYDTDLRELLVHFVVNCGDVLRDHINQSAYLQASNSAGSDLPQNLFCADASNQNCDYKSVVDDLSRERIPVPYVFTQMAKSRSGVAEYAYANANLGDVAKVQTITCDNFLWLIVQGMIYESGIHYANLPRNVKTYSYEDHEISEDLFNLVFFYDWQVNQPNSTTPIQLNSDDRKRLMQNMLLAYMMRNELALTPELVEQRLLPSEKSTNFANEFNRNINSKNKFTEIYMWSKLLPHIQGLLLYLLSLGYPLACIMVIVPGKWTWFFTWMSFFVWAKSWDAGFAVVQSLERSIWGNIGNSLNTENINTEIYHMTDDRIYDVQFNGLLPTVTPVDTNLDPTSTAGSVMNENAMELFDSILILSRVLNHDLANSYYIYLMSALYFAVPAVTGQLLLGAKSGMAGMVKEAIGGTAGEAAGAAKSGASAEEMRHGSLNAMAHDQATNARSARKDGFALRALQQKNQGIGLEMGNAFLKGKAGVADAKTGLMRSRAQGIDADSAVGSARMGQRVAFSNAAGAFQSALGSDDNKETLQHDANDLLRSIDSKLSGGSAASGASGEADTATSPVDKKPSNAAEKASSAWWQAAEAWSLTGANQEGQLAQSRAERMKAQKSQAATHAQLGVEDSSRRAGVVSTNADFSMGQAARGYSENAGRLTQTANFTAKETAYRQQSKFGRQMSGIMAARGVQPGVFDPKDKPRDLDTMGAGGMLGGSYDSAFAFTSDSNRSGFFGGLNNMSTQLSNASADAMLSYADTYTGDDTFTPTTVTGGAFAAVNDVMNPIGGDDNFDPTMFGKGVYTASSPIVYGITQGRAGNLIRLFKNRSQGKFDRKSGKIE